MKKVVFCGGGTAGHVMPNIALIEQLLKDNVEIHYIGSNGIEKTILQKYPKVLYHEITCPKLIRKLTLKNLCIPFKLLNAIQNCKKILKQINPDLIFSKGGYVSVPVVMASKKIPVLAHESDYTMGLANKIIYRYVDTMFFSFRDTALKYKKGIFSGTPIRKEIFNGNKSRLKNQLNIKNNLSNLIIVGGSTGASAINDFILHNLKELTLKYNVIHITGKSKINKNIEYENYYPIEYVDNMGDYLTLADYIISRAGSNAIYEMLALKKSMLLIPLPKDQSRGDQIVNANYFEKEGFAEVIQQEQLSLELLEFKLKKLANNREKYLQKINKLKEINGTKVILNKIRKYLK